MLVKAVQDFLRLVIIDVQRTMDEKNLNATGATSDSLKIDGMNLVGSDNFYWLEHGRAPGGMPPVQSIEDWIRVKGIDRDPWAVAKSIAANGTRIWRNKSLGLSISKIATRYMPELKKAVGEFMAAQVIDKVREFKKK